MGKRNLPLFLPLIILSSYDILETSLYNTVEDEERDAVKLMEQQKKIQKKQKKKFIKKYILKKMVLLQ